MNCSWPRNNSLWKMDAMSPVSTQVQALSAAGLLHWKCNASEYIRKCFKSFFSFILSGCNFIFPFSTMFERATISWTWDTFVRQCEKKDSCMITVFSLHAPFQWRLVLILDGIKYIIYQRLDNMWLVYLLFSSKGILDGW